MKPPPFRYVRPDSVEEALTTLAEYGDEVKILAGGQSLVPMMNFRLARPAVLVDVNRVPGLDGIDVKSDALTVGALTRTVRLDDAERFQDEWAVIPPLARFIGHLPIRIRGTVGGSLAHADPAAELPLLATTLDGWLVARSTAGERSIEAEDFFEGPFQTSLSADEILTEVTIPRPPPGGQAVIVEHALRAGDFAVVAVLAALHIVDGTIRWARVGLGGTSSVPTRATEAERLLVGEQARPDVFQAAGAEAAKSVDAVDDIHASRAYRTKLAAVLVERALAGTVGDDPQGEKENE